MLTLKLCERYNNTFFYSNLNDETNDVRSCGKTTSPFCLLTNLNSNDEDIERKNQAIPINDKMDYPSISSSVVTGVYYVYFSNAD